MMNRDNRIATTLAALLSITTATANAALHARLDGAAAYDDVLNITWLTDASFSGSASWQEQLSRVADLNAANHLGFDDWRIASMSVAGGLPTGFAESVVDCSTIWPPLCQDNELGYLFFHTLGGSVGEDLTGDRAVGDVTFTNIQPIYWSATESGTTNAWMYHFDIGFGVWSPKNASRYAWIVRQGDSVIPDTDGDGVADGDDNCLLIANPDQHDSNDDGFGNICDPDLNNDNVVNFADLALMKPAFLSTDPDADLTGDGVVNFSDLALLKSYFLESPGPSGVAP